jgi:methyl-accepting chemotaxis protein
VRTSVVRKFFLLSLGFGVLLGVAFPFFASIFVTFNSRAMLIFFSISCVAAGLMVGLVSYAIGKSTVLSVVTKVSNELHTIGAREGDLTKRLDLKSNDVIGALVENFNLLLEQLSIIVDDIREISARTMNVKQELTIGTDETVESLVRVTTTTIDIGSEVEALNAHVTASSTSIEEIARTIGSLKIQIETQSDAIGHSTSSVEQMTAAMNNVAETVERTKQSATRLDEAAATGGEKIEATNNIIQRALDDTDSIVSLIAAIDTISAQTNVLAINAAIEGARAGVNGKGFSVIAAEVRELADSTNENAKQISSVLAGTVQKMQDASAAGNEMKDAFEHIVTDVADVARAFDEITDSTAELSSGGSEIRSATLGLSEAQASISEGAAEITSGAAEIAKTMLEVKGISSDVAESMSRVESTTAEITQVIVNVADASEKLSQLVGKLNSEIDRFKTHDG